MQLFRTAIVKLLKLAALIVMQTFTLRYGIALVRRYWAATSLRSLFMLANVLSRVVAWSNTNLSVFAEVSVRAGSLIVTAIALSLTAYAFAERVGWMPTPAMWSWAQNAIILALPALELRHVFESWDNFAKSFARLVCRSEYGKRKDPGIDDRHDKR